MIKLLSLIGTISLSSSAIIPIIEVSKISENKAVQQSIDISEVSGQQVKTNFPFGHSLESARDFFLDIYVSRLAKHFNQEIKREWINMKSIINIGTGMPITEDEASGWEGAGTRFYLVTYDPTELGYENNLIGESSFVFQVEHRYGDLSLEDNNTLEVWASYVGTDLKEIWTSIVKVYSNLWSHPQSALWFVNYGGINFSQLYLIDSETNLLRLAVQSDIDKLNYGEKLDMFMYITPTSFGASKGIIGSAKINVEYALQ